MRTTTRWCPTVCFLIGIHIVIPQSLAESESEESDKMLYLDCYGQSNSGNQNPVRQRRGYAVLLKGKSGEVEAIETSNTAFLSDDCVTSIGQHHCKKTENIEHFSVTRTLWITRATAEVEEFVFALPPNSVIENTSFTGECEVSSSPKI